jgi:hypothetical protein
VDSSLLDEWERMRDPARLAPAAPTPSAVVKMPEPAPRDITRDEPAFTAAIRTRIFRFLRACAGAEWGLALELVPPVKAADAAAEPWTPDRLQALWEGFEEECGRLRLDPEARNRRHTHVAPSGDRRRWRVQQMLIDSEGHNDWVTEFDVDLETSRQRDEPVLGWCDWAAFRHRHDSATSTRHVTCRDFRPGPQASRTRGIRPAPGRAVEGPGGGRDWLRPATASRLSLGLAAA